MPHREPAYRGDPRPARGGCPPRPPLPGDTGTLMSIRERTVQTVRCRTAWLEAGAGWPVILVHAFPLSAEMWQPQLETVPPGWRYIAPHLRGFGGTALPPGRVTIDEYAADVCALMDALEIEDAVI